MPSYRADIDGLRAVAIGAVLAFHACAQLLPGGFVGVDIFFVISGFLITRLIVLALQSGEFHLLEFYQRRVRRIVPALLLVLIGCALVGWFALLPDEFRHLGQSISWAASFAANAFFARSGEYFGPQADVTPLLHLWSLAVEEQFYLAWPLLLWLAFKSASPRALIATMLVATVVASLLISVWGAWHAPTRYFFLTPSRAWELAIGAALFGASREANAGSGRQPPRLRPLAADIGAIAGAALILASVALLSAKLPWPGAWALLPCSGAALLIGAGPNAIVNRQLLSAAPMVWLGKISYPLYLWHWPMLVFARISYGRSPPPLLAAALVAAAIVAAHLTYRLLETPLRRGQLRPQTAALLIGLMLLATAGALVQHQRLESRLSTPLLRGWEIQSADWHLTTQRSSDGAWTAYAAGGRPQTALFIGDSHIQHYWSRVEHIVAEQPQRSRSALLITNLGCPPLPNLDSTRRGAACARILSHALQRAQSDDIDTVVFGSFWEYYLLGEYAAPLAPWRNDHVYATDDPARAPLGWNSPRTQLALEEFGGILSRLVSSGRRTYLVLSNPTSPAFEPRYLLPTAARWALPLPQTLRVEPDKQAIDATPYESYVAPLMSRLRAIAVQSGAVVIDPRDWLCHGMSCASISASGAPNYLDSNHVSNTFAREQALFIDDILLGADVPIEAHVARTAF